MEPLYTTMDPDDWVRIFRVLGFPANVAASLAECILNEVEYHEMIGGLVPPVGSYEEGDRT